MKGRTNLPQEIVYVNETPGKPSMDGNFIWKANSTATPLDLVKVIHGNGYFVAIAEEGTIVFSTDAKIWKVNNNLGFTIFDIICENDIFIMVGEYEKKGVVATSPDLLTWNIKKDYLLDDGESVMFEGIMWNGNNYVLYGTKNDIVTLFVTNNFEEFTVTSCSVPYRKSYMCSPLVENSKMVFFITAGSDPYSYVNAITTNDGVNFRITNVSGKPAYVFSIDGYFCYCDYFNSGGSSSPKGYKVYFSINGVDWELSEFIPLNCRGFISANGFIVGIANDSYLLANSISDFLKGNVIVKEMNTAGTIMRSIVAYDKTIVAVGTGGCIFTSNTEIPEEVLILKPSTNEQDYILGTEKPKVIKIRAVDKNIDSNIVAENIKEGISILGVTGTYSGIQ